MAFSTLAVACDRDEESNELIWSNYVETEYAYVSDMYYYNVPTVKDEQGTNYEVFVDVTQKSGEEVDYFGGFFAIEKPTEYSVVYTVDDGQKEYSKTTTVFGIEKAKYALADASNVIFTVGEEINLDGMLGASVDGEVVYSVKKGEETVEIENNAFTPTQAGTYTVQATMDKQPTHTFKLYVYDKSQRYLADGMILDGTSAQDIQVNAHNDYSASISFDENVKYDSASNGSYKIKATTNGKLKDTKTLSFNILPVYANTYYQALKNKGYEYIAVRYMVEKSDTSGTGRLIYGSGTEARKLAMYYDGNKVKDMSEATSIWNTDFNRVPVGEWAEMLFDIETFTSSYKDENLLLFKLSVNGEGVNSTTQEKIEGSSWDLTMYIDNIYAVKDEATNEEIQVVDKGQQVDLSDIKVDKVYWNEQEISVVDNKLSVGEYGLYEVAMIDRTSYGIAKKPITAKGSKTVMAYTEKNFSARHGNTASSVADFTVENVSNAIKITADDSVWNANTWQRVTYTVKPFGNIGYYEKLKENGCAYITYEYTLNYDTNTLVSSTDMYRAALTKNKLSHYNADGLNAETAATHQWKKVSDNTTGDTSTKTSNKYFQSTSYADSQWKGETFIISVSIDDFIKFYNHNEMNILTLYFSKPQPNMSYTVTFGKIQATTNACVFDA